MDRKKLIALAVFANLAIAVLVITVAFSLFVFVDGCVYPRFASGLNLQEQSLTAEHIQKLSQKLPECRIVWNVPIDGGLYSNESTSLVLKNLTDGDVENLQNFANLKTLYVENTVQPGTLQQIQQRYPHLEIQCSVSFQEKALPLDIKEITVNSLSETDQGTLTLLPQLHTVNAWDCADIEQLMQLKEIRPDLNVLFHVPMGDEEFPINATEIAVSNAKYEDIKQHLPLFQELKELTLKNPKMLGSQYLELKSQYPEIAWHLQADVAGTVYDESTTELTLSNMCITVEDAKAIADSLPNLEVLFMTECYTGTDPIATRIDNETMAAFRKEVADRYKVVWTLRMVDVTNARNIMYVRTDATYFYPTGANFYYLQDHQAAELIYCEDMIAIDVGHHTVKNIDFVKGMPKLKYLILAWTQVKDISPLEHCKELIYLQLDFGIVQDFSVLPSLTNLQDLNISCMGYKADPSPIFQMTWLKNLWFQGWKTSIVEALPDTNVCTIGNDSVAYGWRDLQNWRDLRDMMNAPYMNY